MIRPVRIAAVVTARPSWSRVRSALRACRDRGLDVHVIAAASALTWRHGRVVDLIRAEGWAVTEVSAVAEGGTGRESALETAWLLGQLPLALQAIAPDLVITVADRHETIATALAARNLGLPLLHLQGGERSGSIDDRIRDAVTCLADIHCVSNVAALHRVELLRRETAEQRSGFLELLKQRIYITGCPSIDLAEEARQVGPFRDAMPGLVVVLQHPVTDEADRAGEQMRATIKGVIDAKRPAAFFWPGADAGDAGMTKELRLAQVMPKRNLPPLEFLRLLLGAHCIVGNSSVAIRECAFLGVPAVNVGTRQANRQRGRNVVDVGYDAEAITEAIDGWAQNRPAPGDIRYGDGRAGARVADVIIEALKGQVPSLEEVAVG